MIKYLLILINSLSLFIYSFFGGEGGISITSNIPKSIMPGKEVSVEVKIAKGNQGGFAKMQMELPAGLSAKEGDNQGANFTFSDGIVKWVWASLPMESEIIIKFTLVADASASGAKTITGKYSYVENNAKQVVEMNPVEITIGSEQEGGAANAGNTPTTSPETKTTAPTSTTTTTEVTSTPSPTSNPNPNVEPSGNVSVKRTISKGSAEGEYLISLKVNKGSTKGFARYSDDLPSDINAKAVKTEGASFSVSDGKIKFVWVTVPEKDELEISYTITGVNRTINLGGEYSYLEQNQSKMFVLPVEPLTPEPVSTTTTTQPTNTVAATPTTEPTNTVATTKTETPGTTSQPTETPTSAPQPTETLTKKEGNVNYMVQIGAFTNSAVGVNTLSKKFSITEKIISEMQGGFNKFMVGDYQEYKGARDHREKVRNANRVASAFVVAYNTGKRITVQEALMISNQKWYK